MLARHSPATQWEVKPIMNDHLRLTFRYLATPLLIAWIAVMPAARRTGAAMSGADEENRLIVHEWGTFTSIAGKEGVAVDWHPLNGPSDLPKFVYDDLMAEAGFRHGRTKCDASLIRMETPVVYFYP